MKYLRKLSFVLAVSMALSTLLIGCKGQTGSANSGVSQNAPSGSSQTTGADGLPAVGDFSKKLSLSWYMCTDATAYKQVNPVAEALNQKFNVEMNTITVNGFDNDKMNVTLASGSIPDVIIRWGTQGYYDDGIIQSVSKDMIAKYMPQTYKTMESGGDAIWVNTISSSDGKVMGVPQYSINGDMVHTAAIREDWLTKVNLPMPKTIEDLTKVMRAFTNNDPDGNGKNDTYGMTIPGLHNNLLYAACPMVFGAYGVIPTYWTLDRNGQVSYGAVQEGYKDALKQLAAWYKEGLIDPEWVTLDNAAYQNKITNGLVGFWGYANPGYMNYSSPTSTPSLTIANNPKAKWHYMAPLTGPKGYAAGSSDGPAGTWTMSFGAKASTEQIARAMQIAEAMNTDINLYELTYFGMEGTTFVRNPDGSDAQISGVVPQEYGCQVFRTASTLNWEAASLSYPKDVVSLMKETTGYPSLRNVISTGAIKATYNEMDVDSAEMTKLTSEFFFNAITGAVDIDAGWDAYVQKWMNLGGKVQTDGARTLPIIYKNK